MSTRSWSESGFGVVHEISKAIPNGMKLLYPKATDTLEGRLKVNYSQFRARSDFASRKINTLKTAEEGDQRIPVQMARARQRKLAAKAQVTAAGNISRRKGRYLP